MCPDINEYELLKWIQDQDQNVFEPVLLLMCTKLRVDICKKKAQGTNYYRWFGEVHVCRLGLGLRSTTRFTSISVYHVILLSVRPWFELD